MISACVFDMDGVLVDTEPIWRRVEHDVFLRVGLDLSDAQLRETWGLRIEDVVEHWYRTRPWDGIRPKAVQREIVREMVAHVRAAGVALPGALDAVQAAHDAELLVAIASSSSRELIDAVIDRLEIAHLVDGVCTADNEKLGKPDPGVYLSAARVLDVPPGECVAVEDSPAGVRAARAAGMTVVAVRTDAVDPATLDCADVVIGSMREVTPSLFAQLADEDDLRLTGRRG